MKIAVTGAKGLLGWHASARIHAEICGDQFHGRTPKFELVQIDREAFRDTDTLAEMLQGSDAILHFAGVNRGEEEFVERANPKIAEQLVQGCQQAKINPHIVYANSTHSRNDSFYGRSKRIAKETLSDFASRFTDIVYPHIFGECAIPYYNNVTATLIDKIWKNEEAELNPDGRVQLLHAGKAAQLAIDSIVDIKTGTIEPEGRDISVIDLYDRLKSFHRDYSTNIFPDVSDPFDLALFNSYRTASFPHHYPNMLKVNEDHRGMLFEAAKGGNQPQSFLSTTKPGKRRGDHFHLDLVERFLVVKGDAIIRIRRVLCDEVHEFRVSGNEPTAIDMPPLHTHAIENQTDEDVTTFFWSHHLFDPVNPDTFADPV
ncbi:hypothetical protein [Parasphingorhabdus sp.]|uniref:polysaccharide biosynthesis C-terminal domain-containing protein n=1 Tax=Parasphingorhabdus sp. TaxID=2709688 RepID=UPI00326459C7